MNITIEIDSPNALRARLIQTSLPKKAKITLCLPLHSFTTRLIVVPEHFDNSDIEQHIQLEQATYFPHIADSVYFDIDFKEQGQVLVYAIAAPIVEEMVQILREFGIPMKRAILRPTGIMLNLLPWREWQRQAQQQQCRWLIIAGISSGLLLMGSIHSFLHRDIHRLLLEQTRLQRTAAPYQALLDQQIQANQLKKIQIEQYNKLGVLKEIEVLRPSDLILSHITEKDHILTIDGQAKNMNLINTYENALRGARAVTQVNILSIEKNTDNTLPWAFKVSVRWDNVHPQKQA